MLQSGKFLSHQRITLLLLLWRLLEWMRRQGRWFDRQRLTSTQCKVLSLNPGHLIRFRSIPRLWDRSSSSIISFSRVLRYHIVLPSLILSEETLTIVEVMLHFVNTLRMRSVLIWHWYLRIAHGYYSIFVSDEEPIISSWVGFVVWSLFNHRALQNLDFFLILRRSFWEILG
jgi:hypothetical protein